MYFSNKKINILLVEETNIGKKYNITANWLSNNNNFYCVDLGEEWTDKKKFHNLIYTYFVIIIYVIIVKNMYQLKNFIVIIVDVGGVLKNV